MCPPAAHPLTAGSPVHRLVLPMSRDTQKTEIPAEKLELYDKLIRERPHIERKGVGLPYTSVNGHMFTFLSASGSLALRLPAGRREEFLKEYKTSLAKRTPLPVPMRPFS